MGRALTHFSLVPDRVILLLVLLISLTVLASNVLVSYPIFWLGLSDYLTWGAFTYPVSFLLTDLANRRFGPRVALRLALVGFVCALALSLFLASPRVTFASLSAFLSGQLLNISLFHLFRAYSWWIAPFVSSIIGSIADTLLFFFLAFSAGIPFFQESNPFAIAQTASLIIGWVEVPRWVNWAVCDLMVKMLMGLILLVPYDFLRVFFPLLGEKKKV